MGKCRTIWLAVIAVLAGCKAEEEWQPPFAPAVCWAEPYQWIPPSEVGALGEVEELSLYYFTDELVDTLVDQTVYAGKISAQYGTRVYRYRYLTQDRGEPVEATAVLGIPVLEDREQRLNAPIVVWLHPTLGYSDSCSPSAGDADESALAAVVMASQGFIVVAPDFIGMNGFGAPSTTFHPFIIAEPTALASWDAVRAGQELLAKEDAPVAPNGQVVLWGASQGGHAAFFANRYAPYYAPEFQVTAVVPVIPPADLAGLILPTVRSVQFVTSLMATALVAHGRWYGQDLSEVFTNEPPHYFAELMPQLMDTECYTYLEDYGVDEPEDLFQEAFLETARTSDFTGFEAWQCTMEENSVATSSVPRINDSPMLFVVAEQDDLLDPEVERASFDTLCGLGYRMEYLECRGATHVDGAVWSLLEQYAWVKDRLAGLPLNAPCVRTPAQCCSVSGTGPCAP